MKLHGLYQPNEQFQGLLDNVYTAATYLKVYCLVLVNVDEYNNNNGNNNKIKIHD